MPSNCRVHGHVALDAVAAHGRVVRVHTFGTGPARRGTGTPTEPAVFRTCVYGLGSGPLAWGWVDDTAAEAGHAAVLHWVTTRGTPPPGVVHCRGTAGGTR